VKLGARTWREVHGADPLLLAVPLGSCEQHGPHLPLDTDTRIAVALADGLAAARPDVVVGPAVAYGASGEHAGFDGTLSIGVDALTSVIVELVRSADAFAGVVLVNGHGGNNEAVERAATTSVHEGRTVLAWSPTTTAAGRAADAHAGRTETSLLLALAPSIVRLEDAAPGAVEPLAELLPALRAGGVRSVSANGVLGDPRGASAAEGADMLRSLTDDLVAAVERWQAGR
jgi:mycofactocin system creatininase family protein